MLKRVLKLDRLRLRGPCGARDEFHLAALRSLARPRPAFFNEIGAWALVHGSKWLSAAMSAAD
jgi:hypothetical protein